MNERLKCEHCDIVKALSPVHSMTMYHWNGEGEDPNRDQFLCKECEADHRSYWAGMWNEYRSSQGF